MRCKICGKDECTLTESVSTIMCFHVAEDTNANFHQHDANSIRETWNCNDGHSFTCIGYNRCWCGWSSQYPDQSHGYEFLRREYKNFKFSTRSQITNKEWIDNLMNMKEKEQSKNDLNI